MMFFSALAAAAAFALQANALPGQCRSVSFTVAGSAMNFNLTGVSLTDTNLLYDLNEGVFTNVPVSGSQTLAGVYCEPQVLNANSNKLQVLFHGITGTSTYWQAQGNDLDGGAPYQPQRYSWVMYASQRGYPTLSLDRLGNGKSSHPDPVAVVQSPYEQALYNDLANQIRAGTTKSLPRSYQFLIYVGHSYGSEIGAAMAGNYPKAYDQTILTGFSKSVQPSLPGVSLQAPEPAALHNPAKFGTLDPGYVTSSYEQGRTNSFFGTRPNIDYDSNNADIFYQREDTVSIGQFISTYAGNGPAPAYTGRVLVLTGENDQAFCGPGSSALGTAHCGTLLPDTKSLFPNADYSWHSVPNTGHVVNLHFSSQSAFQVAHDFLAGQTFAG